MQDKKPGPAKRRLINSIMEEVRPHWAQLTMLLILGLLSAPLTVLLAYPIKITIDSILGTNPLPAFLVIMLPESITRSREAAILVAASMQVVVAFLLYFVALLYTVLAAGVGETITIRFRARLLLHAEKLSVGHHDDVASDTLYRVQQDAICIENFVINGLLPITSSAFTIATMVFVCVRMDYTLTIYALSIVPVLSLVTELYRNNLNVRWKRVKEAESAAFGIVREVLSNIRVVKAFGQEEKEVDRLNENSQYVVDARKKAALGDGLFSLMIGVVVMSGTALVLYVGAHHVMAGTLGLGDLSLILLYLGMLYQPLQTIGLKAGSMQGGLASAERAYSLLDLPQDVPEFPKALPIKRATGAIKFNHVYFGYAPGHDVLSDVSFEVGQGETVYIRGVTGAGKSTLFGLLCRFYDPTSGSLTLDGEDMREYRLKDLRRQFAVVLQEPSLINGTIAENIAYARPGASPEHIRRAATLAHADEFIYRLPDGFSSRVGEAGSRLSGGQRQRIALARAFLKDAPILLLDEPTSAVDVGTEDLVMDALETLVEGRTTFFISHRPRVFARSALVLKLEGGRITQEHELLKN